MSTAGMLQPVVVIKSAEDVERLVDALEKSAAADESRIAVKYRELRGDELKKFLDENRGRIRC